MRSGSPGVRRVLGVAFGHRIRPLVRLAGWSGAEAVPALLSGQLTAWAVDEGFLAGRPGTGLAWLAVIGLATLIGAVGTRRSYGCLADIVEPFRDDLARRVVSTALRRSTVVGARPDTAAVPRLTHQVELVRDTFAGLVMVVRSFLFTATAAIAGLVSLAPVVAGLVVVPLVAALVLFTATLPAMIARQRDYVRADDRLGEVAGTVLAGHRDVVACGAGDRAAAMVGEPVRAQAAAERALARMAALRGLVLAVGGWLPLGMLLVLAPWLVRRGLTAGAVLGALVYVCTALQPALRALVLGVAGGGLRFAVTLSRLLDTADGPGSPQVAPEPTGTAWTGTDGARLGPEPATPVVRSSRAGDRPGRSGPAPAGSGAGSVRLHGVTFRYGPAARPVLLNLNLAIPAGERLAVVGPSGAGKSTLVALIAGLLAPQAGTIRLGGVPVTGGDPVELARRRVLIPQEAYVFGGTLEENLRYLHPAVVPEQLAEAVDRLGLAPLATRLGGLGGTLDPAVLSAGERQLIAAVRAYLSPAALVILDEATCHLDPGAEEIVERAFATRSGTTLITVAHRLDSAARADRVLVLDGARTTVGRHAELLAVSPAYRELTGQEPDGPTVPVARGRRLDGCVADEATAAGPG
jgi:ATP-binding cassette subfamily C protein